MEANLRLGDLPQWHFRHGAIKGQLEAVCRVDARDALRSRADAASLLTGAEREELRDQAELTRDFCRENQARLATADEEVNWLERSGVTLSAYLRELGAASDEGLVVVAHAASGWSKG